MRRGWILWIEDSTPNEQSEVGKDEVPAPAKNAMDFNKPDPLVARGIDQWTVIARLLHIVEYLHFRNIRIKWIEPTISHPIFRLIWGFGGFRRLQSLPQDDTMPITGQRSTDSAHRRLLAHGLRKSHLQLRAFPILLMLGFQINRKSISRSISSQSDRKALEILRL